MASSVLAPAPVDYPSSDGRPVAESDHQFIPLTYAASRLRQHFRHRDDVYVAGNLLIYYEEGSQARVAPDVFVVLGAPAAEALELPAVGGPEGAGLRAGDNLARHPWRGPGAEAGAVSAAGSNLVLAVRPDGRLPASGAPGPAVVSG